MKDKQVEIQEHMAKRKNGLLIMVFAILSCVAGVIIFVLAVISLETHGASAAGIILLIAGILLICILFPILLVGLKIVKPNEAIVLTLLGKYYGTLKGAGFYFVNPFCSAAQVPTGAASSAQIMMEQTGKKNEMQPTRIALPTRKISLKAMTLNNERQKINDSLGNPIIIGIVVIWRVQDTAKAMFNVDDYPEFLSIQCDSALRNIVRMYPYDIVGDDNSNEKTLRGSSQEISENIRVEIQGKADIAGLEIVEARITHLAYAPEIAAAMLQRQQASAVVDARQLIVDGAVGMVEMALSKLSEKNVVVLDEERKAAMVSNLLVVLCGNKDAQPIVNSGSIY